MHESATIALGRIGAAAVPDLVRALGDPDPGVRLRAAEALARIGPDAKEAVPELIRLLSDEREHVETRKAAAWALGQIGPPASGAVPELMRILQAPPTDTPQADAPNRGG
jgi:HEAT repeat protein